MTATAKEVVALLKNLERPKKRILLVTYRYTDPPLGGAESMVSHLLEALDRTNEFQIDVVCPEVSNMKNVSRFSERYEFDTETGVKAGLRNVRFARFPLSEKASDIDKISEAWQVQPLFEKRSITKSPDWRGDGVVLNWIAIQTPPAGHTPLAGFI
jgi:hypothetical protein